MEIREAHFVISNTNVSECPKPDRPEFAFIGRSNVGKSSLINMLAGNSNLAKISGKPGKTRLINHFIINKEWYLVDLPGYGYARIAVSERTKWESFIRQYILKRENLYCLFVLIDSRHKPQKIDLEFMEWLGENGVAFAIAFTKVDKLKPEELAKNLDIYKAELFKTWEEIPSIFITSSEKRIGREELMEFIDAIINKP